jgi:uncharacterized membrane protein YtjA (UPF0391 family)
VRCVAPERKLGVRHAIIILALAVIFGALGFGEGGSLAAGVAQTLFFVCLSVFMIVAAISVAGRCRSARVARRR